MLAAGHVGGGPAAASVVENGAVEALFDFNDVILGAALALSLAIAGRVLAERLTVPAAALLLIFFAALSDVFSGLRDALSISDVQRIATVALIVILFDGGMHIGPRRFQRAAAPIALLGVVGTFATAALVAVAAHALLDMSWTVAWLLGAALAPTDPAVTFSVLTGKEVRGRSGTILEGESGVNDPAGIALMVGIVELATSDRGSAWNVVSEFAVEMSVGLAVGLAGGVCLLLVMRRLPLPEAALYPIRVLGLAALVYGLAALVHGSGFLAVFVAGIVIGDAAAPHKGEIERFHGALASLAEMAAFVALGITVDLTFIGEEGLWWRGILIAALLALVIRPLVAGPLLLLVRLTWGERGFIVWSGLKGAVPILLASLAVVAGTEDADRIYGLTFVVVLFSVVVQGTALPGVAARLGVPLRRSGLERAEALRLTVAPGTYADGTAVRDLPLAERAWVGEISRDGLRLHVDGDARLAAGDDVVVFGAPDDARALRRIFEGVPGQSS